MDWRTSFPCGPTFPGCCPTLAAPCRHRRIPRLRHRPSLGLPLGLQLGVGVSLPLFSLPFALGCGALDCGALLPWLASLRWLGWPGFRCLAAGVAWLAWLGFPWALGGRDSVAWLACGDWLPSGNGPKTFLKKRLARDGKAVSMYTKRGENRQAKQTNTNRMSTAELSAAEASAFAAKQSAFRSYSAAVGTEAEQAASEAYHSAVLAYARALDAWMGARKGGAL